MMAQAFGSEPQPTDEDCQFLNVFTPGVDEPSPKTVDSLQRLDLPAGVDIEIKIQTA